MYNYHDPILEPMTDTQAKSPFRFPYLCEPRQTYKLLPFKQKKNRREKTKREKEEEEEEKRGKDKGRRRELEKIGFLDNIYNLICIIITT